MGQASGQAWRADGGRILLRVRLTPKGGRDAIDGLTTAQEGPALKARVRAAPEDGAANTALTACVAGWLDVPSRNVSIASGHTSRTKVIAIEGRSSDIAARIAAAVDALDTSET
jgi:uncharacterized protein YggU (UPF0235/DUF167 family)